MPLSYLFLPLAGRLDIADVIMLAPGWGRRIRAIGVAYKTALDSLVCGLLGAPILL